VRQFARLGRSSEIAFVRRRGLKLVLPTFAVFSAEGRAGPSRIAITVSKTVGGAVERNLVRRRIRGALEELGGSVPTGRRFLIVARPGALFQPYAGLAADVRRAVGKAGA
jgi:ribonuclease P protein component